MFSIKLMMTCPNCNILCGLDEIDGTYDMMELYCDECGNTWEITIKEKKEELFSIRVK